MKRFTAIILILSATAVFLGSCEKNSWKTREVTYPEGQALVKLGLFTAYNVNSPIRIAINGQVLTNELVYAIPFPGGGFNTGGSSNSDYLMLAPGTAKVELFSMNPGTPKPFAKLHESTVTLEANKRYTLFLADTVGPTSQITSWLVPLDTPTPDSGNAKVNFVHAMPNLAAADLYKGSTATTATLLIGNIAYKAASDYVLIPPGTDSFFIRPAGAAATTTPIARRSFTFSNQRIYTIFSRGYNGTTGNRIPNLSGIVNQ
jgi:hypothetical protein